MSAVLEEYRIHLLARGRASGTVKMRLMHIDWLRRRGLDVVTVTTSQLEQELARRRHSHSAEARKAILSSYRVFFAWMRRAGHRADDPALDLMPIRVPVRVPRLARTTSSSTR